MISTKNLIRMVRKRQQMAAIGRKRISLPKTKRTMDTGRYNSTFVTDKGYYVVYSNDQIRFVIPLVYLHDTIFRELFKMSEEKFGLPRDGPIVLPCDAVFMEYIISLTRRGLTQVLEQALLVSISCNRCSSPFVRQQTGQQVVFAVNY